MQNSTRIIHHLITKKRNAEYLTPHFAQSLITNFSQYNLMRVAIHSQNIHAMTFNAKKPYQYHCTLEHNSVT